MGLTFFFTVLFGSLAVLHALYQLIREVLTICGRPKLLSWKKRFLVGLAGTGVITLAAGAVGHFAMQLFEHIAQHIA